MVLAAFTQPSFQTLQQVYVEVVIWYVRVLLWMHCTLRAGQEA